MKDIQCISPENERIQNNNFTDILSRFKQMFDYNADAARFIAENGTVDDREVVR